MKKENNLNLFVMIDMNSKINIYKIIDKQNKNQKFETIYLSDRMY